MFIIIRLLMINHLTLIFSSAVIMGIFISLLTYYRSNKDFSDLNYEVKPYKSLIVAVVTIIAILDILILPRVIINLMTDENGLFSKYTQFLRDSIICNSAPNNNNFNSFPS